MLKYNDTPIVPKKYYYLEKNVPVESDLFNIIIGKELLDEIKNSNISKSFYKDDGNIIIESKNDECNCFFLFFSVFSKKKSKILLFTKSFILCKYWLNGSFIGMGKNNYFAELKEGINTFIIQHLYEKGHKFNFSCRISDLSFELQNEEKGYIKDNLSFNRNVAYLCHSNSYSVNGEQYGFMLVPNDSLYTNQNQIIKYNIIDYYSGSLKKEGLLTFYKKEEINTSDFICDNQTIDYLVLTVEYINSFDEKCIIKERILIQPIRNYANIKKLFSNLILNKEMGEYDKYLLKYYYNYIEEKDDGNFTLEAFDVYLKIKNNVSFDKELYQDGNHYIIYQSVLDNKFRKIYYYISSQGDVNSPYPVLLNFLYNNNENECMNLARYSNRFIAVDVECLGFTSGSYVGEACISEVIKKIKRLFNVDTKRIVATGFSNGATALWSYSIYHPEQMSAIYLLSGNVNKKLLLNLYNKRIINVSSNNDEMKKTSFDEPHDILKNSKEYKAIVLQSFNHSDLLRLQYKKNLLDWMFDVELNKYPKEIMFTTDHMYHNKSYWVTIDGISFSKKSATVHITVDQDTIRINTFYVSSFTIEIPPYINKDKLRIIINGIDTAVKLNGRFVSFSINKSIKQVPQSLVFSPKYKGLGLLYPYLGPLKVYLPKGYTQNMYNAAESFARPQANGVDPNIRISYPIISKKISNIGENSWVVIDNNYKDSFIDSFKNRCSIKSDPQGYYYKNHYHSGQYCILQIIDNEDEDNNNLILYVNTNDDTLYKRSVFIRKILISSYFNGYNPFLNNAALIYDGKKYTRVFEYGMDEEEI